MTNANIEKQEKCCATPERAEPVRSGRTYVPAVDIFEHGDELRLVADVPGAKAEDIDLSFERGQLTVQARVQPRHDERTAYLQREYGVGDFVRTFRIGEDIDASKIRAEVKDGVLTLSLPKAEGARSRKIAVKAG